MKKNPLALIGSVYGVYYFFANLLHIFVEERAELDPVPHRTKGHVDVGVNKPR